MTQPRLLGGRYELDGIVGRGGMAEVFRARDIRLDRIVAVKTLREDLARDATFQARFRREAQSAASLNHPSIVAVYDTGEDDEGPSHVPYIVMEYVDGRTLRDLLRDDRRLLPERALEITDGVLRALDYSHRNGIVHRDIKPGNVMLTRTAEVKVMDFGIARAVSDAQATMTQTAQVIGTAQYLSPEQARGERVDARSDLYSTGCLLYELLTGRPPFLGDSPVAIAYQHVRENPVPPSRLDPEIPPWADSIVLKAMAKDPAQRYQSAAEMRTDIQRALSGVPVAAPRGVGYAFFGGSGGVAVPQVSGLQVQQAESQVTKAGLVPKVQKESSSTVQKGIVIGTSPANGTLVARGTTVTLKVSSGPPKVKVPDVVHLSEPVARNRLVSQGFQVKEQTDQNSTAKPNTVVRQDPAANTSVSKGATITLFISPNGSQVPDVVNQQVAIAEGQLANSGFTHVKIQEVSSPGLADGIVTQQDPTAGQVVPTSTVITLFVVKNEPTPTPTPSSPSPSPSPSTSTTPPTGGNGGAQNQASSGPQHSRGLP